MQERATKKQQELLQYIGTFIDEHDYAPSYREVMAALGYKSVSTVAVHVDGLIAKGFLTKSEKSARSIRIATVAAEDAHVTWLRAEIAKRTANPEKAADLAILQKAVEIITKSY